MTTFAVTLPLALGQPSGEGQSSGLLVLVPYALIFLVFYFLLIAPARKRQKQHTEMLGKIKTGDSVVTNGGLHGRVVGVTDSLVQLRIAENVKVDVSRANIAEVRAEQD